METAQECGAVSKDRKALFDLDVHSGAGGVGSIEECQGHLNRVLLVLGNLKDQSCDENRAGSVGKAQVGCGGWSNNRLYLSFPTAMPLCRFFCPSLSSA